MADILHCGPEFAECRIVEAGTHPEVAVIRQLLERDEVEPVGMGHGQRSQEHGVDETKGRAASTKGEAEGKDRGG
jgi:hypothetical protein